MPLPPQLRAAWRLAPFLLAMLPLLAGCAAQQAVISGHVRLVSAPQAAMPMPRGAAVDPRAAVVYLESIDDTLQSRLRLAAGPDGVSIDQRRGEFRPGVVAIPVGGSLVFRNRDRVFHTVFARAGSDSFDTGPYRPRRTRAVLMREAARFNLFCMLHPGELGVVAVVPTRVYAQPNKVGRFRLPALPLGHYQVHAWHPAHGEIEREVELRETHGADIALDF